MLALASLAKNVYPHQILTTPPLGGRRVMIAVLPLCDYYSLDPINHPRGGGGPPAGDYSDTLFLHVFVARETRFRVDKCDLVFMQGLLHFYFY